ncbi:hypothetical protein DXG01_005763 [Tephrocybe rancida]|nr:hypothetical protein DXG01_005763 [Tephrocybe rancida]
MELPDYKGNAIVYLLEENYEADIDITKNEIHGILKISEISALPIMILALTPTGSATVSDVAKTPGLEDIITLQKEVGEGRPVALFVMSLPLSKGYQEAFEWLSTYL